MKSYTTFCHCKAEHSADLLTPEDVCRFCGTQWIPAPPECEDCTRPATTLIEIHDAAAPATQLVWHEALKCDGHRDELVQQIADDELPELTIEHMQPLIDADVLGCEAAS